MMPRYLIERTFFPETADQTDRELKPQLWAVGDDFDGVIWVTSYVTPDHRRSFCIYDAPSPALLRLAAQRRGLPIDRITEIVVLNPRDE